MGLFIIFLQMQLIGHAYAKKNVVVTQLYLVNDQYSLKSPWV